MVTCGLCLRNALPWPILGNATFFFPIERKKGVIQHPFPPLTHATHLTLQKRENKSSGPFPFPLSFLPPSHEQSRLFMHCFPFPFLLFFLLQFPLKGDVSRAWFPVLKLNRMSIFFLPNVANASQNGKKKPRNRLIQNRFSQKPNIWACLSCRCEVSLSPSHVCVCACPAV